MQCNKHSKLIGLACVSLSLLPIAADAAQTAAAKPIESTGGLKYGTEGDKHWFQLGGVFKVDETLYTGDKKADVHSGANIRSLGLDLDGGIGYNVKYTIGLSYDAPASKVNVEDLYLTYTGWGKNTSFSVGQVHAGFSLTNTSSSKWIPFRERSMPDVAFAVDPGIGFSANTWDTHYSVTAAITQPKATDITKRNGGNTVTRSDRWSSSIRGTYAPIQEDHRVIQLGVSAHLADDSNAEIAFSTDPEARARNTTKILNTQTGVEGIVARAHSTVDLELSGKYNSFKGEAEYIKTHVRRGTQSGQTLRSENLSFHGYHVQASYLLTGETYPFKPNNGTFGQVIPQSCYGAWEVAARYSYINLNHRDITGGSGHATTIAVSWYANENVRVIGEYVRANLHEYITLNKRKLNIFGLRLQAVL